MEQAETASTSFWACLRAVKNHWIPLMSGGTIMVGIGLYERWSAKNVPAWVYVLVLIGFGFWASYLAWRDERRKVNQGSIEKTASEKLLAEKARQAKREMIVERLREFLGEANEVSILPGSAFTWQDFVERSGQYAQFQTRVENFLNVHCGAEAVERFRQGKALALEELISEHS